MNARSASSTNAMPAVAMLLLAAALCAGCQPKTSDRDLESIDLDALRGMLDERERATVVVDVRPYADYDRGHIPGAVSIPFPQLRGQDPILSRADRIVVYAGGFDDPLAPAAAKRLMARGYDDVFEYRGGVSDWQGQGLELQRP